MDVHSRDNIEENDYNIWELRQVIKESIWREKEKADRVDIVIHNCHYSGATSGSLSAGMKYYYEKKTDEIFIAGLPNPNFNNRPTESINSLIGLENPLNDTHLLFDNY